MVTGAKSGIGWHTALELARPGGEVILAARTETKGHDAVERIRRELSQAKFRAEVLDLASLRSGRAFTAKVGDEAKLDLLENNAGVMAVPKRQVTEDGFELQFGTNFLGPFALTGLLIRLRDLRDAAFIWFPRRESPAYYDRLMHECFRGGGVDPNNGDDREQAY